MKLVKIYEDIIREGKAESCVAEFGKVLFGDQLGKDEKNTGIENKHAKAVYNFTSFDFGENMKPEIKQAIISLQGCMSTYPEVLKPNNQKVFRGTSAPLITFINNGIIPKYNETAPYLYKPKSPIQSWTEYESSAETFGDAEHLNRLGVMYDFTDGTMDDLVEEIGNIRIPIIMVYTATEKDFLFKGEYLNQLSEFGSEHEVLRIDGKPINVNAYLNDKHLNKGARIIMNRLDQLL
jgi:hypothetical protein